MTSNPKKSPNMWGLVAITYGLVTVTALLAVSSYFYFLSEVKPGDAARSIGRRRLGAAEKHGKPAQYEPWRGFDCSAL